MGEIFQTSSTEIKPQPSVFRVGKQKKNYELDGCEGGVLASDPAPCRLMLSREQGKQNLWGNTDGHWTKWVSSSRSWHRVHLSVAVVVWKAAAPAPLPPVDAGPEDPVTVPVAPAAMPPPVPAFSAAAVAARSLPAPLPTDVGAPPSVGGVGAPPSCEPELPCRPPLLPLVPAPPLPDERRLGMDAGIGFHEKDNYTN